MFLDCKYHTQCRSFENILPTNFKINIKLNDEIVCKKMCAFEDITVSVELDRIFKVSMNASNLS